MVQALEILKGYITCEDEATRNKFYNLLDSYWHKNDGHILKSHTVDLAGNITFTFIKADGSTFNVSLPALPNSKPISFIEGLQDALNNLVSKVPGKGLSTEDFTTELLQKLNSLQNYQHPLLHSIAEVDGLGDALAGKQPVAPDGWGFTQENYSLPEKDKLGKLAILHYAAPTTDLVTLAAITAAEREDGQRRFVHSEGVDYFFKSGALEGDIAPTDVADGFWIRGSGAVGKRKEKYITNTTQYTAVLEDKERHLVFQYPINFIIPPDIFAAGDVLEGEPEGGDVTVVAGQNADATLTTTVNYAEPLTPVIPKFGTLGFRFRTAAKGTLFGTLKPI